MKLHRRTLLVLALATGLTAPTLALADGTIKIGSLATLEGPFTVLGQDSMRGLEMALKEHGGMAGGMKIKLVQGSSDASPDSAVKAARKLVEQDGVQILIGPLSGDEGLAVNDYANTQPNVTFVNGTSAAQVTALRDPAPNFFRFSLLRPSPRDETMAQASRIIHAVHLDSLSSRKEASLSHGEHRQLELALALLDEPAAGLSPAERRGLVAILNALPSLIGHIIIEHDLDVALKVSSFVTMMHNGRIFKVGTPEEIESDPQVQAIYLGSGHG